MKLEPKKPVGESQKSGFLLRPVFLVAFFGIHNNWFFRKMNPNEAQVFRNPTTFTPASEITSQLGTRLV